MTSIVAAVLVITLLLPGLALLFAIVIRFALRGAPRAQDRPGARDPPGPAA